MMPTMRHALQAYEELLTVETTRGRPDYLRAVHELVKVDLFFLLVVVMSRRDLKHPWIYDRCVEVQEKPDGHLDLWAREHYKSTIITFGKTIQDILIDPEITVGIFSHSLKISRKFLWQIKHEFEVNALLRDAFPDILYQDPQREADKWSENDGIVVKRKSNKRERTIEAWGLIDGMPTASHYDLRVYDDIVTEVSVTTPEQMEKIVNAWELSQALGAEGGRVRYIGTRYHFNDAYKTVIERQAAIPRRYPGTADGKAGGPPVLFTPEYMADKRRTMGARTFNAQILQDPRADIVDGFDREDVRYWSASAYNDLNLYLICDPANEKSKKSDYTAMLLLGYGSDLNVYVLMMIRDRLNLDQRTSMLMSLHRTYRPRRVGYERYGMQSDLQHIEYVQKQENYRFDITELGTGAFSLLSKQDRIRKLGPWFRGHRVWLPDHCIYTTHDGVQRDMTKVFVDEELMGFPYALHDDMLDALARIEDPMFTLAAPMDISHFIKYQQAETDYDEHNYH